MALEESALADSGETLLPLFLLVLLLLLLFIHYYISFEFSFYTGPMWYVAHKKKKEQSDVKFKKRFSPFSLNERMNSLLFGNLGVVYLTKCPCKERRRRWPDRRFHGHGYPFLLAQVRRFLSTRLNTYICPTEMNRHQKKYHPVPLHVVKHVRTRPVSLTVKQPECSLEIDRELVEN